MAKEAGLSRTSIRGAFGLPPHRAETFKLSSDPHFVEKVRDLGGLYMSPPARALVPCVDEKSRLQALDRTQPVLPMKPGIPERRTHDSALGLRAVRLSQNAGAAGGVGCGDPPRRRPRADAHPRAHDHFCR